MASIIREAVGAHLTQVRRRFRHWRYLVEVLLQDVCTYLACGVTDLLHLFQRWWYSNMYTISGAAMDKTGTTDSCLARCRRDWTDYHTTGGRQQYARAATNVWHVCAKGPGTLLQGMHKRVDWKRRLRHRSHVCTGHLLYYAGGQRRTVRYRTLSSLKETSFRVSMTTLVRLM